MKQFMSWERLWLFRRQKRRMLSLKHPLVLDQFKDINEEGTRLLGWTASEAIDRQLLHGIFFSGYEETPYRKELDEPPLVELKTSHKKASFPLADPPPKALIET
jgi:hypothetical protein